MKCCLLNWVLLLRGCCVISEYGLVEWVWSLLLIMCVSLIIYMILIDMWLLNGLLVCLLYRIVFVLFVILVFLIVF